MIKRIIFLLMLMCAAFGAQAQQWPDRPVQLVLPFAAGGAADVVTRIIMAKVSQQTGQQFLVDNRTGGSGIIGTEVAANAAPDGYTFLVGSPGTMAINPNFFPSLPYNPAKDFVPVVHLARFPQMLAVSSEFKDRSAKQFIELIQSSLDGLDYGSSGNGSTGHLITEKFLHQIGAKANHIPYRGGGPAVLALAGAHVDFVIDGLPSFASQLQGDRIRILAITSSTRWKDLPDIPTIAEVTGSDFDMGSWVTIFAPAGTPAEIVKRFAEEATKALQDPGLQKQLLNVGAVAVGGTPEDALAFFRAENDKWAETIRISGAKP